MIEELYVKDYVLFDKATIDFNSGMTVITGETGAGKSLLIDAIGLLSGDRITGNVVRSGSSKAVLQMTLSNLNQEVIKCLESNDYEVEENLIIQRTITDQGKSSIKINSQPATLSFVRQIVSMMIDIHSQMDTYQLMNQDIQLKLLDAYASCEDIKDEVREKYLILSKCKSELKKAKEKTFSQEALDEATQQYNEIVDADIKEDELDALTNRIKSVSKSQQTFEDLNTSIYALDKENGILDSLFLFKKNLRKIDLDMDLDIDDIYHQFNDLSECLKNKRESLQRDAQELDALQDREHFIKRLYRKYGGNYHSMMEFKNKCMDTIDNIIHRQAIIERLEKEQKEAQEQYNVLAEKLSQARKQVFEELSKKIEEHCHDLMLEKARFKIQWKLKEASSDGIDDINFMVSMNPGQDYSLLKQSASGGELSRLMLALKVVFQSEKGINTIIFDEIDTGVSGKVAFAMGQKMKTLSKEYQVLCITHLSSVAAWANHHYRVVKNSVDDKTFTQVETLDQTTVFEELALMSHGEANSSSISAAKELKERVSKHG